MGYKLSKYSPLHTDDKSIELEEYSPIMIHHFSVPEISLQCQKLIILGFPLEAYNLIQEKNIDTSLLYLPLHTLEFLILISKKKSIDALLFAQKFLAKYKDSSFVLEHKTGLIEISVTEVMGLLCYENPESSILAYMLDPSLRSAFASLVESILNPTYSRKSICRYFKCCKKKRT